MSRPNVLFLADTRYPVQSVIDNIDAITTTSLLNYHIIDPLQTRILDRIDLSLFDAIGLHYSIKPCNTYYLSSILQKKIAAYRGVKFIFLENESQQVSQLQSFMYDLGIDILFTRASANNVDQMYPDPRLKKLKKISVLSGYVQDSMKFLDVPSISDRKIDISYRSRPADYSMGALGYDRERIGRDFIRYAEETHLNYDIKVDASAQVYGPAWFNLLMQSKAVLGTEAGASIWDFDGKITQQVKAYLKKHPQIDFDLVYEAILKPYDGRFMYPLFSPRIFEAAATKTPMILYRGEYQGICKADIHYIPLEKDFSNFSTVVEAIRNIDYLQSIAENAYEDLILSDTYSQHQLARLVAQELLLHIEEVQTSSLGLESYLQEKMKVHYLLNQVRKFFFKTRHFAFTQK